MKYLQIFETFKEEYRKVEIEYDNIIDLKKNEKNLKLKELELEYKDKIEEVMLPLIDIYGFKNSIMFFPSDKVYRCHLILNRDDVNNSDKFVSEIKSFEGRLNSNLPEFKPEYKYSCRYITENGRPNSMDGRIEKSIENLTKDLDQILQYIEKKYKFDQVNLFITIS